jgi:hypothetical protein
MNPSLIFVVILSWLDLNKCARGSISDNAFHSSGICPKGPILTYKPKIINTTNAIFYSCFKHYAAADIGSLNYFFTFVISPHFLFWKGVEQEALYFSRLGFLFIFCKFLCLFFLLIFRFIKVTKINIHSNINFHSQKTQLSKQPFKLSKGQYQLSRQYPLFSNIHFNLFNWHIKMPLSFIHFGLVWRTSILLCKI